MKRARRMAMLVALVLSFGLLPTAPVAATNLSIVRLSGTATECAGWTTTDPVSAPDPLDPANYIPGTWGNYAVPVSAPPIGPWINPTTTSSVSGAVWVSSAATTEGGIGDVWYLFKEEFTIPPGAVISSASLYMTADNAVEAYLNGSSVGSTGYVYGAAPSPQPYYFANAHGPYSLAPVEGSNILVFVVRNWVHTAYNPTGLLYRMEVEYEVPDIEKTMPPDGYLGDQITVVLDVENPYGYSLTVEDVIPDGLKYIPGTFEVDGNPVAPTIVGSTISTTVGNGDHQVTFDVQVVEVEPTDVPVTNWAYLKEGTTELDSDSEVVTLHHYEGFSKQILRCTELDPYNVPMDTDVHWLLLIGVQNILGDDIITMEAVVVKDRFGGDLEADEAATKEFINPPPSSGAVLLTEKGKTKKVFLTWNGFGLADGGLAQLWLEISTDMNPGQGKKAVPVNEYTEAGEHELNSGAVLKFIDPETGFQLSAHTPAITVVAYEP